MATKKGKKLISVDFTGVEAGSGGGRLLPEDRYLFEVEDVSQEVGSESGAPYLSLTLVVADGEFKGTKAWDNVSLQPQSLWKLRGFMEAGGLETTDGPMELDPDDLVGILVMGDVIHEEYKGKSKHRVNGYASVDDSQPEPAPAAASKPAKKRPGKSEPEPETPEWKEKQKVAFMDGKKRLEGVISEIDGDDITVRVGKEEYVMSAADIEAA